MSKPINMRRCVVCRQVRHKSELIRVAKNSAGEISINDTQGRGAYVCKSETCAAVLIKRRNFDKVFKVKVSDEVYDSIKENILMK